MPSENGSSRLDRVEHALELLPDSHIQFREQLKQLLGAQVVLTDRIDKLAHAAAERRTVTTERSKEADERLNALIKFVEELNRNRPRPNGD